MSHKRQAERKHLRCQAIVSTEVSYRQQCNKVATGHVRLPAKAFVCAEHRRLWKVAPSAMAFAHETERAA